MMNARRKSSKSEKRTGLFVMLIVIALVVFAIIFVSSRNNTNADLTHFLEIPLVETTLTSESGTTHMFGARVALELETGAQTPSASYLHDVVFEAISNLSYEDITSFDGMSILRQAVRDSLEGSFAEGNLVAVYFTDVLSDAPMPSRQTDRLPPRNIVFDAIFGNQD